MSEQETKVYLFYGEGSKWCNGVFSSLELARSWIRNNSVTGLLTAYHIDDPCFDRAERLGNLPGNLRGNRVSETVERYVDGYEHHHFVYGLGDGDEGFDEANRRWHEDHGFPYED